MMHASSQVLLDQEGPTVIRGAVKDSIENSDGDRVADLHVWSIGPGIYAAFGSVVSQCPKSAGYYRKLIPSGLGIVYISVEVHHCTPAAVEAN
ncbi:MAG: hypothetical protein LC130_26995 [Bryobacterales bacterium]|nr:hypothetical protein [Bryobacterales bacterium]